MTQSGLCKAIAPCMIAFLIQGGAAAAQEACTTYVVQEGDTLGSISQAAYGRLDYQLLFNANAETLRSTTNLVVGTELLIPCADGRLDASEVIAAPVAAETAPVATGGGYKPTVRFVTGGDWYPFADEGLTGGGFLIRLVSTAMQRGNNSHPYTIDWVDDWGSHETVLLPTGAFDISVAWYQPDCTNLDALSEMTQNQCLNYIFSSSLYDAVFNFVAAKGGAYENAQTFADLQGARICRPEGYSFHDLDAEGLIEPAITLMIPPLVADCFDALLDGSVDIVTVEAQFASVAIAELGIADQVVENPRLTSIQAIAAMAWKANPRALEFMTYLNRGIAEMRDSGEWNDLIASSLKEANDKLVAGQ